MKFYRALEGLGPLFVTYVYVHIGKMWLNLTDRELNMVFYYVTDGVFETRSLVSQVCSTVLKGFYFRKKICNLMLKQSRIDIGENVLSRICFYNSH